MRQSNTCFLIALLLRFCGALFSYLSIFHRHSILQICLGTGLMGWLKRIKVTFESGCVLYFGQFGMCEMILFLTKRVSHHFCRLFLWSLIESICGPIFSR